MSDPGMQVLTTLAEAGGIAGMIALVAGLLIRMVKKKGCTWRCYTCAGTPLMEIDCEEGAPAKRYRPKQSSPSTSTESVEAVELEPVPLRVVRPRDLRR